jgi:hypothetical protein
MTSHDWLLVARFLGTTAALVLDRPRHLRTEAASAIVSPIE